MIRKGFDTGVSSPIAFPECEATLDHLSTKAQSKLNCRMIDQWYFQRKSSPREEKVKVVRIIMVSFLSGPNKRNSEREWRKEEGREKVERAQIHMLNRHWRPTKGHWNLSHIMVILNEWKSEWNEIIHICVYACACACTYVCMEVGLIYQDQQR